MGTHRAGEQRAELERRGFEMPRCDRDVRVHSPAPESTSEERLVLTVSEAAVLLGISRAFAYELVARGELPVIRLGRRRLVDEPCGRPHKCPHGCPHPSSPGMFGWHGIRWPEQSRSAEPRRHDVSGTVP